MKENMKIKMSDLRKICNKLLDNIEALGFDEIEFKDIDYYLTIISEKTKLDIEPQIGVGSLYDDVENIMKVLDKTNPLTILDFARCANLLFLIEEEITKSHTPFIDVEFFKDDEDE